MFFRGAKQKSGSVSNCGRPWKPCCLHCNCSLEDLAGWNLPWLTHHVWEKEFFDLIVHYKLSSECFSVSTTLLWEVFLRSGVVFLLEMCLRALRSSHSSPLRDLQMGNVMGRTGGAESAISQWISFSFLLLSTQAGLEAGKGGEK